MSEKPEEKKTNIPEGFDETTGPFAKPEKYSEEKTVEDYASFADAPEDIGSEELETDDSDGISHQEENEAVQQQLQDAKEQVLRAMAEAENTRKRAQKDREEASKYAISSFARDLLSVADNLRRALDAIPEDREGVSEHFTNLQTGIEATERELLRSLERNGIKKLTPLDEPFDPNFHEVMFEAPMADKQPGTVIQVMEEGYVLHDRLLRPARVGVAKAADEAAPTDDATGQSIDTEA